MAPYFWVFYHSWRGISKAVWILESIIDEILYSGFILEAISWILYYYVEVIFCWEHGVWPWLNFISCLREPLYFRCGKPFLTGHLICCYNVAILLDSFFPLSFSPFAQWFTWCKLCKCRHKNIIAELHYVLVSFDIILFMYLLGWVCKTSLGGFGWEEMVMAIHGTQPGKKCCRSTEKLFRQTAPALWKWFRSALVTLIWHCLLNYWVISQALIKTIVSSISS